MIGIKGYYVMINEIKYIEHTTEFDIDYLTVHFKDKEKLNIEVENEEEYINLCEYITGKINK